MLRILVRNSSNSRIFIYSVSISISCTTHVHSHFFSRATSQEATNTILLSPKIYTMFPLLLPIVFLSQLTSAHPDDLSTCRIVQKPSGANDVPATKKYCADNCIELDYWSETGLTDPTCKCDLWAIKHMEKQVNEDHHGVFEVVCISGRS